MTQKLDSPTEPSTAVPAAVPIAIAVERPRVELWMSQLLRLGTALSLALVTAGAVLTFTHHPSYFSSDEALERVLAENAAPHRLGDVVSGILEARGRAVTMLGLLLLILLPVLRLAVAHLAFRAQGDRTFARISLAVLVLLFASFFLGAVE